MKTRGMFCIALLLASVGLSWPSAVQAAGHQVFLHLKTGITQDDNQMCVAFNIAQAALAAGDQVEMFFDAAAVFDLQNGQAEDDSNAEEATSKPATKPTSQPVAGEEIPYNLRYELPDKLKQILSQQFGVAVEALPKDYYGYLKMLQDNGATLTFNGAMAHLVSLSDSVKGKERLADIATPLDLQEIVEHRARADVYFVY